MLHNVSLNKLKYPRISLLEKVTHNRNVHQKDYEEAVVNYRKVLREEFSKKLAELDAGKDVDAKIKLPKPVQYLKEYDRAIAQLGFTTDDLIELDSVTFAQLVLDEWAWKDEFENNTKSYQGAVSSRW